MPESMKPLWSRIMEGSHFRALTEEALLRQRVLETVLEMMGRLVEQPVLECPTPLPQAQGAQVFPLPNTQVQGAQVSFFRLQVPRHKGHREKHFLIPVHIFSVRVAP